MSGLILCTKKSDIPFRIEDADINVYSIEEIAYYLYNNAYFLDENFFSDNLIQYIEVTLRLDKTAERLKVAKMRKIAYSDMVMMLIISSGYYTEHELKQFEKELKAIGSKSMLEKMKARADMLYDKKKYISARKTYRKIIKNKAKEKQDDVFYSGVYTGLGKVDMKMFYLDNAVERFEKAYKLSSTETTLSNLVYAKLLREKFTGKKADLTGENAVYPGLVVRCEEEIKDYSEMLELSDEFEERKETYKYDKAHNKEDYREKVFREMKKLKEEYRSEMS